MSNTDRTFAVILNRKSIVDNALTALVKRATRKGVPVALSWSWGKAYRSEIRLPNQDGVPPAAGAQLDATSSAWIVPVERVPLLLAGETPRMAGWRFVATLQRLDDENVVRCLPGEEIPASYRNQKPACDHCRTDRRRNDTYILRHGDGRLVQVGSSCIKDFLGGDDAAIIAAQAEVLALATATAAAIGGEESCLAGGGSGERLLADFLPIVAWIIRTEGWRSRTMAREQGGLAAADRAWNLMHDAGARRQAACEPADVDVALASSAEAWAERLSDAAIEAERGDYLHNLRAIARSGLVSYRTSGIAASAIVAYQRAAGEERARAERASRPNLDAHLGSVGAKVSFGLPEKVGKGGKPGQGAPTPLDAQPVVLDFVHGYDTNYGHTTVLKFKTQAGATLVWKASGEPGVGREDVGRRYALVGTIKSHAEYRGEKQTVLVRCSLSLIP